MAFRKEIPAWMKELWKELTTPPKFLNVPKPDKSKPPKENRAKSSPQPPKFHRDRPRDDNGEPDEEEDDLPARNLGVILRSNGYPPKILESYPFLVRRAMPFGPVMRLETPDGAIALKRSRMSPKRLLFMWRALQYVEKNGFDQMARIVLNKENLPFTVHGNEYYYASEWIAGQSADFSSMSHIGEAALAIARFHQASRGFETTFYQPQEAFGIDKILQTRAKQFDLFLSKARGKRRPDAVDRFVIRHIPDYRKQAQQAAKLLEDPRCQGFLKWDRTNPGLCHLDITPQNLIYTPQRRVFLIDFDMMSYGPRMLDIGHMIRRGLQANEWKREPALLSLVQANRIEPLRHAEYRILQAILTFPHSVWKSCHAHYMNQPTPYTLARLELLLEQERARQLFLQDFADHVERHRGS